MRNHSKYQTMQADNSLYILFIRVPSELNIGAANGQSNQTAVSTYL